MCNKFIALDQKYTGFNILFNGILSLMLEYFREANISRFSMPYDPLDLLHMYVYNVNFVHIHVAVSVRFIQYVLWGWPYIGPGKIILEEGMMSI